jgi:hypothetical protein
MDMGHSSMKIYNKLTSFLFSLQLQLRQNKYNLIEQLFIFVLGGVAMLLISSKHPYAKYGYLVGLLSQPFILRSVFKNKQWGLFGLSLWYTFCWMQGIYNFLM